MSDNSSNNSLELHSRGSAGIRVSLWWSPADGRTWVEVRDVGEDAEFVLPVLAGERARDVFEHPYAYAARHGVRTAAGAS